MPTPFSALYDSVLPFLPGAQTPLVDATIRKAAREFLRRTTVAREHVVFTTGPEEMYQLQPTAGVPASVLTVTVDGAHSPLPVVPEHVARAGSPAVRGWSSPMPHLIKLFGIDAGALVDVELALTLSHDATAFPDGVFENYAEALALGTLSIMYSMPGKPWTSTESAKASARGFGNEIRTVRSKLRDGGQPNASTFSPSFKFGR